MGSATTHRSRSRTLVRTLWCILFLVFLPSIASAHPFGSQYFAQQTTIKLEPQRIQVEYLIEVPTTVIMQEFYVALKGRTPSREEDVQFTREKLTKLLAGLKLTVDGKALEWRDTTDMKKRNGVGNMNFFVYRVSAETAWSPAIGTAHTVRVRNDNYAAAGTFYNQQIWASDAVTVKRSGAWGLSGGQAAVDYAGQWYNNPVLRDVDIDVQVNAAAGGPPVLVKDPKSAAEAASAQAGSSGEGAKSAAGAMGAEAGQGAASSGGSYFPQVEGERLQAYLKHDSPWMMIVALFAALFFGAAHALSPGHGKTLVAAYLVGTRHTVKHAIILGLAVTASHTSSVILLGIVTLFLSKYILSETLYPYITAFSGLSIVAIGLWMIRDRWRLRRRALTARYELGAAGAGTGSAEASSAGGDAALFLPADRFVSDASASPQSPRLNGVGERGGAGGVVGASAALRFVPFDAHAGAHGHSHAHDAHAGPNGHSHAHDAHAGPNGHSHAHDAHVGPNGHSHAHDAHVGPNGHSHAHDGQPHGRPHHHWGAEHEHDHSHMLPEDGSVGQLIRLGIAGGIVPCPTATVVLITAIALHRIVFGLALVMAFSVGLAAVLVAIGVALVLAGSYLKRFTGQGRVMRYLPIAAAVVVTVLGVLITASAWRGAPVPLAGSF